MMRKQLQKPNHYFSSLNTLFPSFKSFRRSIICYSPPMPHFCRLDHWSFWWDTVRIENREVTWLLHKSIHFVYPIRVALEFVPLHSATVGLTFVATQYNAKWKKSKHSTWKTIIFLFSNKKKKNLFGTLVQDHVYLVMRRTRAKTANGQPHWISISPRYFKLVFFTTTC